MTLNKNYSKGCKLDFKIKKREVEYSSTNPLDIKIANEFTKQLLHEIKGLVKSVVLYGSKAKNESGKESDIDVLVILDDVSIYMSREINQAYIIMVKNIVSKISKRLHINTLRFTAFWEYSKNGDPIVINMLRDGIPLYDTNFFIPLKILLLDGRIRPTEESIWNYFSRSPLTLINSKWHILQATIDLYWAVIDSAHAALMKGEQIPPSPDHVADMLEQRYVKTKILEKHYVDTMRKFYRLMKMITHRELKEISGQQFDLYYKEAEEFVNRMKKIIEH